jgi:hypothetical protein
MIDFFGSPEAGSKRSFRWAAGLAFACVALAGG